jgi:exosortase/archaeosortase family protein
LATVVALLWVSGSPSCMAVIQRGLAGVTGTLLNVLGHSTSVHGNTVGTESFGISVVTACTGIFILGLYLLAVIAYPCGWISKLLGVLLGIGGVFILNLIRLISLFYVGMYIPQYFDVVHQLVWQSLMIAFVVLLWLFWAGRWTHAPRKA